MSSTPVTWFEIGSDRPDEAQRFYSELFGWSFDEQGGPGLSYRQTAAGGERGIGGAIRDTDTGNYAIFYAEVTDVPETCCRGGGDRRHRSDGPGDHTDRSGACPAARPVGQPARRVHPARRGLSAAPLLPARPVAGGSKSLRAVQSVTPVSTVNHWFRGIEAGNFLAPRVASSCNAFIPLRPSCGRGCQESAMRGTTTNRRRWGALALAAGVLAALLPFTAAAAANTVTVYYQPPPPGRRSTSTTPRTAAPGPPCPACRWTRPAPAGCKKTIDLGTATGLQVVFNNGSGVWDNNNGANYRLGTGNVTVAGGGSAPATRAPRRRRRLRARHRHPRRHVWSTTPTTARLDHREPPLPAHRRRLDHRAGRARWRPPAPAGPARPSTSAPPPACRPRSTTAPAPGTTTAARTTPWARGAAPSTAGVVTATPRTRARRSPPDTEPAVHAGRRSPPPPTDCGHPDLDRRPPTTGASPGTR